MIMLLFILIIKNITLNNTNNTLIRVINKIEIYVYLFNIYLSRTSPLFAIIPIIITTMEKNNKD